MTTDLQVPPRVLQRLDPDESMRLLATVPFGRMAFAHEGGPEIRTLNHVVDQGRVVVRTHLGSTIAADLTGGWLRVAYQADDLDPVSRLGWSVTIVGTAAILADEDARYHYERVLRPWLAKTNDTVIVIRPASVNGYAVAPAPVG